MKFRLEGRAAWRQRTEKGTGELSHDTHWRLMKTVGGRVKRTPGRVHMIHRPHVRPHDQQPQANHICQNRRRRMMMNGYLTGCRYHRAARPEQGAIFFRRIVNEVHPVSCTEDRFAVDHGPKRWHVETTSSQNVPVSCCLRMSETTEGPKILLWSHSYFLPISATKCPSP